MKETPKQNFADNDNVQGLLADTLEDLASVLRTGACHATHSQLAGMVELVSRMASPSNLLTTYLVCRELGGITSRTLYNWVDAGIVPRPHQIAGAGNTNFWYSDEIAQAREELKKKKYI